MGLSSCSTAEDIVETITVSSKPVEKPELIVPQVDQLQLRSIEWKIITEDNYRDVFGDLKKRGIEPVLFGLTATGYENLALNNSDMRQLIQQYQEILAIYEDYYTKVNKE